MRKNTNKSVKSKKQDSMRSKKEDEKSVLEADDGMDLEAKQTVGANIGDIKDDMSNDFAKTEKNMQQSALIDPADQVFDQLTEGNQPKDDDLGFKDETPKEEKKEPITEYECEIVKTSWFGIIEEHGLEKVGEFVFRRIFENAPDAIEAAPWKNDVPLYGSARFLDSAYVFMKGFGRSVNSIDDPEGIYNWLKELGKRHKKRGIRLDHFPSGIAAVRTTLQHFLGQKFTPELDTAWAKAFDLIASPILEPYINDSNPGGLTDQEIKNIQVDWKRIEDDFTVDRVGVALFKNAFSVAPELLSMFPFSKEQNLYQSAALRQHAVKVMRGIGRVVVQLENMENIKPLLVRMGRSHANLGVLPEHYDALHDVFLETMEQFFKNKYTDQMKRQWSVLLKIICEVMCDGNYEEDEDGNMTKVDDSERYLVEQTENNEVQQEKINEQKEKYLRIFRKEVDFHHKVAYRFEKAYRLGKKMKDRMALLNIDIVDLISDHSGYIDSDPMALFYCLFFCIYYNNPDLVEFLRTMIYKMTSHDKIDRLLEYIDVNGLERLRTVGEPMNAIVYHLVFYQSIDDDLRIVYSQILRQLRFVQMRDKDALHFLNQRDYDLIRLTFTKNTTKINLLQFFPKTFPMKSSTYRKYNQAYYEEIVINNDVESRVAQNYRERFLVTAEDIYIVFEMYCKEDYDEQFQKTPKDEITHKQFVDLFIICLRNDSFKIAIMIYTCYLTPSQDMDNRMMDILMSTIRESVLYHEHKLFYLHQHFDVLTIYQMNHLVDIYQEILNVKDARTNPMINQYNTIKIALLIFRICWKIEVKQIYSLITKCSLLQSLLIKSLSNYFERQNNILTLYKFMAEPILHMNERKDSLDIMYEMNMQDLLKHPVVVEVLNLVYEGKYSVSSSSLSMSQTFQSLLDMPVFNLKSVMEKLIQNVVNFGDTGGSKQTSLQYNIWKQSIQQREQDEMLFTVIISATLIGLSIMITQILNTSFQQTKEFFGKSFGLRTNIFLQSTDETLQEFCPVEIEDLKTEYQIITIFYFVMILNTIGMFTSLSQKIIIFRNKDNVTLNYGQMCVEVSIVIVGIIFIILNNTSKVNTLISDVCSEVMDISDNDKYIVDHVYTMRNPREGEVNFKMVVSVVIIQSSIISILMLQRTQYLGELIMMLDQMLNELGRFFATFGLIVGLFLLLGRMLGTELKEEHASFFEVGLDLFDAFNGNQNFGEFIMPIGQTYIAVFMYLFKVLLISLLAAMFINKYKRIWQNLDAYRRFNIIKQKNSVAYDKYIGGITLTFFPINILMIPLTLPILVLRSPRASDFLLKIQYVVMMLLYCTLASIMVVPASPILYIKAITNSMFIAATNKRQAYKGEGIIQLLVTVLFGPVIIIVSILIDLISLPAVLLKDSRDFERKYQMSSDRLNDKQIDVVMVTFGKIFYGGNFESYRGKHMTLIELMMMHRIIFALIDNLHDLVCRGTKDYKESLSNVQDYNMTKILTRKASIPDKSGDYKEGRVELDVIYAVQMDIELYNYVDVVLRKFKMGKLQDELKAKAAGQEVDQLLRAGENGEMNDGDEEDDETKKMDGIQAIFIGPDGVPLKRNNSDVMNNFFVDFAVRSFTEIEKQLKEIKENGEQQRLNKFQAEIDKKKEVWKDKTVGTFVEQTMLYDEFVKMDLDNSNRLNKLSSRGSGKSFMSKGKKSFKENDIKEKKTESTDGASNSDDKPLEKKGSIESAKKSVKSLSRAGSNVNSQK